MNYKLHIPFKRLYIRDSIVIFRPSKGFGLMALATLFIVGALLPLIFFIFAYCCEYGDSNLIGFMGVLLFFLCVGILLLFVAMYPVKFDLKDGLFWFGYRSGSNRKLRALSDVSSMRIRTVIDSSCENGSDQYELVLVLKKREMIKLANYAYFKSAHEDGLQLSLLLKIEFSCDEAV